MKLAVKKELVQAFINNPHLSNNQLAERYRLSSKGVAAVRRWHDKKGVDYLLDIEGQLKLMGHKSGEFTNFVGIGKSEARDIMVENIRESRVKTGMVLTLPYKDWKIEKLVHNTVSKRFGYDAVESDPKVFLDMVANMGSVGVKSKNKVHYGKMQDRILAAKTDEYAHALLDYCGTLENMQSEILHLMVNNLVQKDGTVAVTLLKARCTEKSVGKINKLTAELSGQNIKPNDNTNGVKMFFKMACALTDFEVVQEFEYRDSSPMILIVLKRTK